MDLLKAWGEWILVVMLFSSVVGAGKLVINKKKRRSPLIVTGLILWAVVGFVLFFILFCHANSGKWLWE